MSAIQLLRMSVHQRISAAAEDVLQQLENGEKAAKLRTQRAVITARLTATAEEIFGLFKETLVGYEERLRQSEQEICLQRKQLDAVLKPEVRLQRSEQMEAFKAAAASAYSSSSGQLHSKSPADQSEEEVEDTGAMKTPEIKISTKRMFSTNSGTYSTYCYSSESTKSLSKKLLQN